MRFAAETITLVVCLREVLKSRNRIVLFFFILTVLRLGTGKGLGSLGSVVILEAGTAISSVLSARPGSGSWLILVVVVRWLGITGLKIVTSEATVGRFGASVAVTGFRVVVVAVVATVVPLATFVALISFGVVHLQFVS